MAAAVVIQALTFFMSVAPGELLELLQFGVIAENQIIDGQCSVVCGLLHFPLDCDGFPMVCADPYLRMSRLRKQRSRRLIWRGHGTVGGACISRPVLDADVICGRLNSLYSRNLFENLPQRIVIQV